MKKIFTVCCLAAAATWSAGARGAIISQWNFNSNPADANTGTGTTSPSTGSGTASLVGGPAGSFSNGDANGGSTDPSTGDDSGWQTTGYPGPSANDQTAGAQFAVSTAGFKNLVVNYDVRHSNTSSRYEALQYSTDGGANFNTLAYYTGATGDTWFNARTGDLSLIPAANDNPNFVFRVVAAFESSATGAGAASYAASNTGGTYAGTGTWRFDMVTLSGDAVPEPASGALAVLGGLVALAFRRR